MRIQETCEPLALHPRCVKGGVHVDMAWSGFLSGSANQVLPGEA